MWTLRGAGMELQPLPIEACSTGTGASRWCASTAQQLHSWARSEEPIPWAVISLGCPPMNKANLQHLRLTGSFSTEQWSRVIQAQLYIRRSWSITELVGTHSGRAPQLTNIATRRSFCLLGQLPACWRTQRFG